MTEPERWFPSHIREIPEEDCRELLAAHEVGRVAYSVGDGRAPVVVPVNYTMEGDALLLRLGPNSNIAHHLQSTPASFEIDDYETYNQSGWSVLARGHSRWVDAADHPASQRLLPWAEGRRTLVVLLEIQELTGRRLLPA
ncbi:pyridoxamine 5'-phosphate oxidase family protein [Nocardioides sp. GY 10113]|uniref:pyridoxamine 5'-phosphate oxidase family protein n=1 Tax=Nocardioides sp. GY 10113 TaxID=2569761 RepID=UPI00145812C8|nr:pyridoxamine 5'-phosphate oxidase family protein [Nocardioides sp. GY 10113]